jgi:hypothetical protein
MEFQYHNNWITQTDESKGCWQAISKEEKTKKQKLIMPTTTFWILKFYPKIHMKSPSFNVCALEFVR